MQKQLEQTVRELKIRNYSHKTAKSYLYALKEYFAFKKYNLDSLDTNNIRNFLLQNHEKDISAQTRNLFLNAIKFFYREIVKTNQKISIQSAKKNKSLPVILSKDEIEKIIETTKNTKHKLLLSLAYGAGLRVNEIINLKVKDIDLEESTVHLKQAKGKKDRITIFPEKLKENMQNLIAGKDKNDFIFASERRGKLTTRTAQKIFKNSLKKSGVKKEVTFHSLRHYLDSSLMNLRILTARNAFKVLNNEISLDMANIIYCNK
ncbi:MAG: tyrosine-type recombinase/integrase [Candidatus Humimicrobiaceae bacterium]